MIPNYCAWGCGSLINEPLMPEFKTYEEKLDYIEQRKKEIQNPDYVTNKSYEVEPGKFQMRLF